MMPAILRDAMLLYGQLDPRDRADARFVLNESSWHVVATNTFSAKSMVAGTHRYLYGLPVELSDDMPAGEIRLLTETRFERQARRLAAEGIAVNVTQFAPVHIPEPTLKALLRHWLRKAKQAWMS